LDLSHTNLGNGHNRYKYEPPSIRDVYDHVKYSIGFTEIAILKHTLINNKHMKYLDLSSTQLSSSCAEMIAEGLKMN
jgi:hypothetical protein